MWEPRKLVEIGTELGIPYEIREMSMFPLSTFPSWLAIEPSYLIQW